jgi:hypothetical protein
MATTKYLSTASGTIVWDTATNWSDQVAPAAGDTVTISNSSGTISGSLNQIGITLASLNIPMTFTGSIGLAAQVPLTITGITRSGATATATTSAAHGYAVGDVVIVAGAAQSDYNITATITAATSTTFDYTVANSPTTPATTATAFSVRKGHCLRIGATLLQIGDPGNGSSAATGSGRIAIDTGSIQTAITINNTKTSGTDANLEPVRIIGTHASNTLAVMSGLVGVATTLPTETATILTTNITGGKLNFGSGVTWGTVYQTSGTFTAAGATGGATLFDQSGGTATLNGVGTVANTKIAGTCNFNLRAASGDTVTSTMWLLDGSVLDLTGNPTGVSVATLHVSGEVTIKRNLANPGHFTWTTLTQDPGSTIKFE